MPENIDKNLYEKIHASAVQRKFWDGVDYHWRPNQKFEYPDFLKKTFKNFHECPKFLCLVHSEVTEALEKNRAADLDKFKTE